MRQDLNRYLRIFLLALLFGAARNVVAVEVQEATDMQAEAQLMQEKQVPMLLMFSAEHCGYCERLKSDFLKPMLISGDYTDRVLIRRVEIDNWDSMVDFDGNEVSRDEFASRYNIRVTPTVVFLDHTGGQLASKMVGLTTPDFYGGYLDKNINTAHQRLLAILRGTNVAVLSK